MDNKKFGYGRVSSDSQKELRQLLAFKDLGIKDDCIYIDKKSGKDFDREQYQKLKGVLKENDLLIIKSIDRLGRDYNMILEEWRDITKNIKADIKVIDMELLDTTKHKDLLGTFINDLILQILCYVADQERRFLKQRQREGINAAKLKGVKFGRKVKTIDDVSDVFYKYYAQYKKKQINLTEMSKLVGCCRGTCYNTIKLIENQ